MHYSTLVVLMALIGNGSWFGGPHDPEDSGHTASGGTTKEPGIAVYNHKTLGGYWRVTAPNGKVAILKQTDIGPAPWTGRKVDVTYSALGHLGYNEHNFPTDSQFKADYLGRNPAQAAKATKPSMSAGTFQNPLNIQSSSTQTPDTFDKAGFQKALARSKSSEATASLFSGSGAGDTALRQALRIPMPSLESFQRRGEIIKTPEGTLAVQHGNPQPSASNNLHGILPEGAKIREMNRKDQGRDVQLNPGQKLLAPGKFIFEGTKSDPSGFGPDYPIIKVLTGEFAGHTLYYGHTDVAPNLQRGRVYGAGTHVATTSRSGHNAPPGWLELGYAPGGTPGPFGQKAPF